ncbi:hypothetical protein MRX96_022707 [Rhipicephalus microplus]
MSPGPVLFLLSPLSFGVGFSSRQWSSVTERPSRGYHSPRIFLCRGCLLSCQGGRFKWTSLGDDCLVLRHGIGFRKERIRLDREGFSAGYPDVSFFLLAAQTRTVFLS